MSHELDEMAWKSNLVDGSEVEDLHARIADLCEALEAAIELFEMDDECIDPGTDAWIWLKRAKATLAKARGETK